MFMYAIFVLKVPILNFMGFQIWQRIMQKENIMWFIHYWRASETLTGVMQLKIGDVYLFVYMYGRT